MTQVVAITHYTCSIRAAVQTGTVVELAWEDLPGWLFDASVNEAAAAKGAAGYVVAAPVNGQRSAANTGSTRVLALDWDRPGAPAFDPGALEGLAFFAYTTDSHLVRCEDNPNAEQRWRVWVLLDREYTEAEVRAAAVPWAGAVLRNASQPVFLPTKVESVEWVVPGAGRPWALPVTPPTAPAPTAWTAPATRTAPSQAATNALVTRWLSRPEGTNRLAGATGACLAEWGWADSEVRGYLTAWLSADPKLAKHIDDAVRGAQKRRAGDRIVGFPTLAQEGVDFRADVATATADDLWALLGEPTPPAGAAEPRTLLGAQVYSAQDIATWDPPPIPWLCEALCLAPGAPGLITGYGGSGKTTFVQHLALTVATPGARLLGQYPVRHGSVLHIDHEQGSDLTRRRYRRLGVTPEAQLELVSYPKWALGDPDPAQRLAFVQACAGRALVIVDSLLASCAAFLESGENDSSIREPLDFLGQVAQATGATFLVIHHSKKNRDERMTSARGSSAITDAISVHMTFEKEDLSAQTKPVLELGKVRYERPRGALTDAITVAMAPRGVPADEGYTLVEDTTSAERRTAGLETRIVELLATEWTGSVNALVKELKAKRNDVFAAVENLRLAGTLRETGLALNIDPE